MSDATQAVRLLEEMERLERAETGEVAQISGSLGTLETAEIPDGLDDRGVMESSGTAKQMSMTALLELLVGSDFDLGRAIVDSTNDA